LLCCLCSGFIHLYACVFAACVSAFTGWMYLHSCIRMKNFWIIFWHVDLEPGECSPSLVAFVPCESILLALLIIYRNILRVQLQNKLVGGSIMGRLQLVGSLKLQVSFAGYSLFYKALLQKRPIILRSLLLEATPY